MTTAGAEAAGESEATFPGFEPATGAADAGGDIGAEAVSVGPATTGGSGGTAASDGGAAVGSAGFATVTDPPTGEGVGRGDAAGGDAVAFEAFERQDLLELVSPGLMHLRPLAGDIWLLPRRNRRQRGGRRHHLRRLIREHARLHRLRMRTMRPIQNHDRRRRDPRHEDDRDRALARKERPPGFGRGRCWPRAPDAEFRPVRDRGRPGGRDDNRVCPRVLVPPLAQSRLGFRLGFGALSFHDPRSGFRLPCAGRGDKLCEGAFRTLMPIRATSGAILRRGLGAPRLYNRRSGFRLPWTGEGDEPCEGAFRTLAPTRTARAILRLGDKRRRRFSEHLVTATFVRTTLVRTRLLRKPHGSLIDPDSLPVETGTVFALG